MLSLCSYVARFVTTIKFTIPLPVGDYQQTAGETGHRDMKRPMIASNTHAVDREDYCTEGRVASFPKSRPPSPFNSQPDIADEEIAIRNSI
jgi:hypothetical protein